MLTDSTHKGCLLFNKKWPLHKIKACKKTKAFLKTLVSLLPWLRDVYSRTVSSNIWQPEAKSKLACVSDPMENHAGK